MGKLYSDLNRKLNKSRLKGWKNILEANQLNSKMNLDRRVSTMKQSDWKNKTDQELVVRHDYMKEMVLNEDASYVPRFNIKKYNHPLFSKFPPNKQIKYNKKLMALAIKYGMVLMVQYRGERDSFIQGHQRVVYPMVLGTSKNGKPLLRIFHLRGWSVSNTGNTEKKWRLFRTDRILSMSFTGTFFRLPPSGYQKNDSIMRGGIIKAADFSEIREKQKELVNKNIIQNKKEVIMDEKKNKVITIRVQNTNTQLDLHKPFNNPNINEKDKKIIRMTLLKSVGGNRTIAILGALGQKGNIVKVSDSGKFIGNFKVLKSGMGDNLGKPHFKRIGGTNIYDLYVFVKKV